MLRSNRQVVDDLIKYDISRAHACSETETNRRVGRLKEALCYVTPPAYNTIILELARMYDCTHLLERFSEMIGPAEFNTITNPTANVPGPKITAKTRQDSCSTQRPTEQCPVCHTRYFSAQLRSQQSHTRIKAQLTFPDAAPEPARYPFPKS